MSKGLEALEKLRKDEATNSDITLIKRELKALEIIKKKNVDICILKDSDNVEEYNQVYFYATKYSNRYSYCKILTKEEYDLLKEVLL